MTTDGGHPCQKCSEPMVFVRHGKRGGVQRFRWNCRRCTAERGRASKANFGGAAAYRNRWAKNNREKHHAHKVVEYALKSGSLIRQPCERCGSPKSQAHHEDYSKPREVMWLCPKHHHERHREISGGTGLPGPLPDKLTGQRRATVAPLTGLSFPRVE